MLGGWAAALVLVRAARPSERDPYWQARDGLERWNGTPLAREDSWSYAQPDGLFRPTSPGWNTALGLAHDAFGIVGIAVVGALGMLGCIVIAVWLARQLGARPLPILASGVLVAFLALQMLSPRATVAIQALLLLTLAFGYQIISASLPRASPWLLGTGAALLGVGLGWLGSWIHVSWSVTALGLALALPGLAIVGGASRLRVALATAVGLGLAFGSCIGPYGLSVWRLTLDVSQASDGEIVEWLPPFTEGLRGRWVPVALICIALVVICSVRLLKRPLAVAGTSERSRWALEVALVGISLAATVAGLFALRFLNVAAMTLFPVLAAQLSSGIAGWRAVRNRPEWLRTRTSATYWRPIFTGAMIILVALSVSNSRSPGRPEPEADLARELPNGCHLFTEPNSAGAVLLMRPDIKVWIDMRTEVYGNAAYTDTRLRLTKVPDVTLPQGTTCAFLPAATATAHVNGSDKPWTQVTKSGPFAVWLPENVQGTS